MSQSPKSRPMAAITMAVTTAAIFGLYFAGKRSKSEEQGQSIYHESQPASAQGAGQLGGDSKSGSSGVREAMHSGSKQS
ncbi:hypothetical protein GLOTRDRAFT_112232 [Gloeophyllum trabeum ATCC 11539]|uniref:Uncharacterized protein n=1 Tax=Gloeophyllum trabeum (strain ATCC 11539 / FP-39264 / Madison 617) TaxID=670483 RepID=S7PXD8_GLOTA|nr:uncharacterized protein GLOTRDRAFT_112232 [Gloeophyllum trabeum ATCC 11539]EPQ52271.1 hypothetical protein GLOTRDRAFT_112232 [Gloeophyllum trabeum ATCC 11539]